MIKSQQHADIKFHRCVAEINMEARFRMTLLNVPSSAASVTLSYMICGLRDMKETEHDKNHIQTSNALQGTNRFVL